MSFYCSVQEAASGADPYCANLLFIHIITLIVGVLLSFYGLWGLVKYTTKIFKNWHLLGIAFAIIVFIPTASLFEHFDYFPSPDFWHRIVMFASVAAFYFVYRFVLTIESKEQENFRKSALELLAITAISVIFSVQQNLFEDSDPIKVIIVYSSLFGMVVFFTYLLFEILRKVRKMEASFSLKSFVITMSQPISFALFILTATSVLIEFIIGISKSTSHPFTVFLIIIQNPFYIMLAMTLACFTYIGTKVHNFYSPIEKFLQVKKKDETVQQQEAKK